MTFNPQDTNLLKKIRETTSLKHLAEVAGMQTANVCKFLETLDKLEEIPVLIEAFSIQDMLQSTALLLYVTTSALTEEINAVYNQELFSPDRFGNKITNMPDILAHTLNVNELDRAFEHELEEDEDEDDDEEDESTTT